jgi:predicted dehydrogenase
VSLAQTLRPAAAARRPRVGFLGVGWIGRHRLAAMTGSGLIEAAAICDTDPGSLSAASEIADTAIKADSLEALLSLELDGLVIATPSASHAEQAMAALDRGVAVFCQKPLGRTAAEASAVVDAARRADRLLAVDLSYRLTAAAQALRSRVGAGEIGPVFAADLTFHNAYGPDKPWFFDRRLSGGGCVIDLGVHLVDLGLWMLDFPDVVDTRSALFAKGDRLAPRDTRVEDFAIASLTLATGAEVRLACSWNLDAGCDAVIEATFHGRDASLGLSNVGGSFYDFEAHLMRRQSRERIAAPPDDWGGRAAVDWARRLAEGAGFDPQARRLVEVAAILDQIYGR